MLPRVSSLPSPFQTFDKARQTIDALISMTTHAYTLRQLGIDPVRLPNTLTLAHADIVRRFVPSALLQRADLDPGVLVCLEARDACRGWETNAAQISQKRTGNFLSDFANFSRRTETSGWRLNALVLLVDDVVVYRAWGGQPHIDETEIKTNPLGPLQELGPSLVTR